MIDLKCFGLARWMRGGIALVTTAVMVSACSGDVPKLVPLDPPEIISIAPSETVQDENEITNGFRPKVDILFVVDDSDSMDTHQNNLSRNIEKYVGKLANNSVIDYHVGVITTDMERSSRRGRLVGSPYFVDRKTPNGLASIKRNILVGTGGAVSEKVWEPILAALSDPLRGSDNFEFLRDDAYLNIVILTDADDQSSISTGDFINQLIAIKGGDSEKVIPFAVVIENPTNRCSFDPGVDEAERIIDFVRRMNGKYFDLCGNNFGTDLAELGDELVRRVRVAIPLSRRPKIGTIRVFNRNNEIPKDERKGWSFNPETVSIVIGPEYDPGTFDAVDIRIEFEALKIRSLYR